MKQRDNFWSRLQVSLLLSKVPYKSLAAWLLGLLAFYVLFFQQPNVPSSQSAVIPTHSMVNAVVFVAMSKLAADPIVESSISSVRNIGKWDGDIYVLTDHPACFQGDKANALNIRVVEVPRTDSILEIKALKAKLFDHLPTAVHGILYMDVDIVIRQNFDIFFRDLSDMIIANKISMRPASPSVVSPTSIVSSPLGLSTQGTPSTLRREVGNSSISETQDSAAQTAAFQFDFAAFPDAKGHFVGFCAGCEKWHTGVMFFRRGAGLSCLSAWHKILLSGKYGTDQQSLDEAEHLGYCPHAHFLPAKHLLFAKDYLGMMFTSGHTFIHMTAAGRLDTQDAFYRYVVVPRLRKGSDGSGSEELVDSTQSKQCH